MYSFLLACSPDTIGTGDSPLRTFLCGGGRLAVVAVPLRFFEEGGSVEEMRGAVADGGEAETVYVYEDRWWSSGPIVRSMLRIRLGLGCKVYARNCEVREVDAGTASEFLLRNHVYGPARAAHRLGLFRKRATGVSETGMEAVSGLVAVATFSSGRVMSDGEMSYEWIRYASVRDTTVVGGMGRLLDAFARKVGQGSHFSVMTYCDSEWYGGQSYLRLGFRCAGERPPVDFLCGEGGSVRIHAEKTLSDRKYRGLDTDGMVRIMNTGSVRYVRRY